jgi:microcystin-dependent protein
MNPTPKRSRKLAVAAGFAASLSLAAAVGYAADALFIDKDGVRLGANLNFGNRMGALITLWNPDYTIGIQGGTMYSRANRNFVWYSGGSHSDAELNAGGGTSLMTLSTTPAAGKGTLDVGGTITGKGAVPAGAILLWSGDAAALPAGWVLCNGENNTPDLSGRFVVGYQKDNPDYAVGNKAGEALHTLTLDEMPPHNHGEAGEHSHTIWASGHGWAFAVVQSGDSRVTHDSNTARTNAAGAHSHAVQGGGRPQENRPPY